VSAIVGPMELMAPPSKSVTHRACLLAALASSPCRVRRPLAGADCRSTLAALTELGARFTIRLDGDIDFEPTTLAPPQRALDCGNSGTTLRLLIGQAARLPFAVELTGDASLRGRPNGPLLDALQSLGVAVTSTQGRAPIIVHGVLPAPLKGPEIALPGGTSSQYATSLLLAMVMTPGRARLRLPPPVASKPYLELTVAVAEAFGLSLDAADTADGGLLFDVVGGAQPRPPAGGVYDVEGDWSGAAFPLIGAILAGVPLRLVGLRADSRQGDRAIVTLLGRFGARLNITDSAVEVAGGARLRPVEAIDVGPTPDLFPPLCALAACAPGTTRLHGSPGLRHKESDRIAAMASGLRACGIRTDELDDGLVVHGGRPAGATVTSLADHRIAMSFAILGLACEGAMTVDDPDCVEVSYPDFHAHLARLKQVAGGDRP